MEVSGAVFRQSVGLRWGGAGERNNFTGKSMGRARQKAAVGLRQWADESHSLYYASSPRCSSFRDTQMKEVKSIAAFGTELSREFAALYSSGLGLDSGVTGGETRGKMIEEVSELLLVQINQKKAKEKVMKKRHKEEKAALKARKMPDCASESSSSSSESSDSECDEVMEMNKLTKNLQEVIPESLNVPNPSPVCNQERQITETAKLSSMPSLKMDITSQSAVTTCSNRKHLDKIEVCMGVKCKKSGAVELLQELEKKVGIEGAVVGCKCMGKCRQGPNVRVVNHGNSSLEGDLVKKPLCIGVGLDDIGAIAANFLSKNDGMDMGFLAA